MTAAPLAAPGGGGPPTVRDLQLWAYFWLLAFIGGTYAQLAARFSLDPVLCGVAFALLNVLGLILYFTVFRMKHVILGFFTLSIVFAGMAAAAGAWGGA